VLIVKAREAFKTLIKKKRMEKKIKGRTEKRRKKGEER
jgi:hypothetical protein